MRLRCAQDFCHIGRWRKPPCGPANHHSSRWMKRWLARLFAPKWEKMAEPERSAGEVDEGSWSKTSFPAISALGSVIEENEISLSTPFQPLA